MAGWVRRGLLVRLVGIDNAKPTWAITHFWQGEVHHVMIGIIGKKNGCIGAATFDSCPLGATVK
jgi:hypothetical protein